MNKLKSFACDECGWIKEYDQTHREYSDNECSKLPPMKRISNIQKKVIKPHETNMEKILKKSHESKMEKTLKQPHTSRFERMLNTPDMYKYVKKVQTSHNIKCEYCGWHAELPESHIQHSKCVGCKYISDKYIVWFDEDGELEWKEKPI